MRNCLSGLGGARCELPMCNVCREKATHQCAERSAGVNSSQRFPDTFGRQAQPAHNGQGGHRLLSQELCLVGQTSLVAMTTLDGNSGRETGLIPAHGLRGCSQHGGAWWSSR